MTCGSSTRGAWSLRCCCSSRSPIAPLRADDQAASRPIQEEIWALPLPLPMFAYLVRPVGDGPFPLVIMNHGVSLNPTDRSFFPLVEFRDAAKWFAKRGYLVVAPVGTGYGASAIDIPEHGTLWPVLLEGRKVQQSQFPRLPAWRLRKSISGSSTT